MSKLIVIIGVTGNQGGSVARRFLNDPSYRVRGISRNPASPAAQALSSLGVEIVQADLDDVESLAKSFEGANIIFSVTNYWEPFFRPDCRKAAVSAGISCRRYAYDVELRQGKNITDAAARVAADLADNGFIASTLSNAKRCSGEKFRELYHFDSKADVFPYYAMEKHPELAKKMSLVQTGYFMGSWKLAPEAYLRKQDDGTYEMSFPMSPLKATPHLAVREDMGNFIYAVSKCPPGTSYMAAGVLCTWPSWLEAWSNVTGMKASYKECSLQEFVDASPDRAFGREVGDMFLYSSEPGYDGGATNLVDAEGLSKIGIECKMTSLEEYFHLEDFSSIL